MHINKWETNTTFIRKQTTMDLGKHLFQQPLRTTLHLEFSKKYNSVGLIL
ncbi:hypothetical protein X777_09764 [Ooceraea biroi]|uniref:Uncharacterized protein n=1 Tax=Ooceraea biroi TaxID=2015173 RepID=A0A026W944_OOCBI|nr:hypothetical protein X777_09764 [Ooceraea biroi]